MNPPRSPLNPVIGKRYRVVCAWWSLRTCYVPIMGPLHEDAEHIGLRTLHYHIDWRFVREGLWHLTNGVNGPLGQVILVPDGEPAPSLKVRRITCRRTMPIFPSHLLENNGPVAIVWITRLEKAYSDHCLKTCEVCPHRGVPLHMMTPDGDGNVVCPGHGLKWNLKSGRIVPRMQEGGAA